MKMAMERTANKMYVVNEVMLEHGTVKLIAFNKSGSVANTGKLVLKKSLVI
jgi:hypothetical protein